MEANLTPNTPNAAEKQESGRIWPLGHENPPRHSGQAVTPSAAEKLLERPVEETETWQVFADYFEKHEGFKPHPRDSRVKELYNYYCVGLFDASRHSGQSMDRRGET